MVDVLRQLLKMIRELHEHGRLGAAAVQDKEMRPSPPLTPGQNALASPTALLRGVDLTPPVLGDKNLQKSANNNNCRETFI